MFLEKVLGLVKEDLIKNDTRFNDVIDLLIHCLDVEETLKLRVFHEYSSNQKLMDMSLYSMTNMLKYISEVYDEGFKSPINMPTFCTSEMALRRQ
jgi:hypothetical protein